MHAVSSSKFLQAHNINGEKFASIINLHFDNTMHFLMLNIYPGKYSASLECIFIISYKHYMNFFFLLCLTLLQERTKLLTIKTDLFLLVSK